MNRTVMINYLGRKGGGCLDSYEAAKGFLDNEIEVVAVVSLYAENLQQWKKLPLKKLIVIKTYKDKVSFIFSTVKFILKQRFLIRKELKGIKIDFIYCPMITYWTGFLNDIFQEIPVFTVNHDPIPHEGEEGKIENIINNHIYQRTDIIIVHSKKFAAYVKKRYKKPCVYLPLGRHDFYKRIKGKRSLFKYDETKHSILFFGRISPYKGLDDLCKAYKKLEEKREDVELIIAGNGAFGLYVEMYRHIRNVSILNQWIADEELESLFKKDNLIVVLPYKDATQSGVVLVAMDYGVPVIATNTGGLAEQVENGKTGLLVKPGDPEELY